MNARGTARLFFVKVNGDYKKGPLTHFRESEWQLQDGPICKPVNDQDNCTQGTVGASRPKGKLLGVPFLTLEAP